MEIKNRKPVTLSLELQEQLAKRLLHIDEHVSLHRGLLFNGPVKFGGDISLVSCRFDAYSYVSFNTFMRNAEVGRFCSIAHFCEIGFPLTSPQDVATSGVFDRSSLFDFYATKPERYPSCLTKPPYEYFSSTKIGHDVWIGAYASISANVTIGTGAVIAANTVVTEDVPPYAVVGNGPHGMQILKTRFSDEVIADLMASKWWEYDLPHLAERAKLNLPAENDIPSWLELLRQKDKASWPRLKDNWYYLIPEDESTVNLYPVPSSFKIAEVCPLTWNKLTKERYRATLVAQNRYEKTHAKRRAYHLSVSTATKPTC